MPLPEPKKFAHTVVHHTQTALHHAQKINPRRVLRFAIWIALFGGIAGALILAILVAIVSSQLPDPDKLTDRVVAQSTKIYDRTGTHLLYEIFSNERRTLVELEEIPTYAVYATIAIEDKKFFEHRGVRWVSVVRAGVSNLLGRKEGSGGASTITQQLVKNAIVGNKRTLIRKIKEAVLATKIEKTYTKNQILKLYFNEIAYGSSNYGIEAASQAYFGKTVHDITLAEAATLAALPKAPTRYLNNHEALRARRDYVLEAMADQGYITSEQAQTAQQIPLELKARLANIEAPHFVLYVKERLTERFGEKIVETGGLTVITTLDYDLQKIAEEEVKKGGEYNAKNNNASNAALVAIDPKTGAVIAMVGSRDYFDDEIDGQVNVALRLRQPGSSFKPFVYLAGFERGYTPTTVLYDTVTNFAAGGKPYIPHNYDAKEHGPVTVRKALQGSLNIPAVKMLYLAGVHNVLNLAGRLGYTTFTNPDNYGLALVLGGAEVKLLEHTGGYATLANQGKRFPITTILEVKDHGGSTLFKYEVPTAEQAVAEEQAAKISAILSDDAARAYVFGAGGALTLPGRPVAAKTGTTNDYKDGWTMGYTPSLAAGVWVGNNDNKVMKPGVGGTAGAAPIWHAFMNRALEGKPVESFPPMPEIKTRKPILNGMDAGGVPVKIDRISGKLATEDTPEEVTQEVIFMQPHSILHYINKDDPTGPAPVNPAADPQYAGWEAGVRVWIEKKQKEMEEKGEERTFILGDAPTEFDDVHKKELRPSLTVITPQSGATLRERIIDAQVDVSASRGVARVAYFLDGAIIGEATNHPFALHYENREWENGQHTLLVKAYDDVSNMTSVEISFSLDAAPEPPNVTWVSPKPNNTIFASLFPLQLEMHLFKKDNVQSVKIFVHREGDDARTLIGETNAITDTVLMTWNSIPQAGTYILEPKLTLKDGSTISGSENNITVRE
ncbi:MAG: PBP1A family penicillin-binding protein [Candidatus Magasanikbacteria bacterium]|nr:PBP1A family penicillin-binding protein [Candidatus Magasanikbacteria bacterium]